MLNIIKSKWSNIPLTVKVSTSYAICSILQKCLSFITLPLFTRLLTTEQYGQYTIYSSWSGILMIFLTLNLAYGSFQTAMIKYEDKRAEYISSIQGVCILLSCLFSPLLAFILVFATEEKGYARIIGYALINILVGVIIFFYNAKKGEKIYNSVFWKYALSFNIPLIAYYLSQVVFNQSDRIMISHMVGISEAAMYGVAYNLATVLSFILNSINGSYVPWMYGKIKEGNGEENKTISVMLVILIGLMILCVIWYAPEIILIMAGKQYLSATYVVAPVALSLLLLFYCQLFINVEFYFEEKKMLVYGSIGAAIINIILNYVLIPFFGFVAAGYTTLFSYVVFALSNYYTMNIVLKKRNIPDNLFNYKELLKLVIGFTIVGFLGVIIYDYLVIRIIITLFVLILLIINKNKFINTLKSIKNNE